MSDTRYKDEELAFYRVTITGLTEEEPPKRWKEIQYEIRIKETDEVLTSGWDTLEDAINYLK